MAWAFRNRPHGCKLCFAVCGNYHNVHPMTSNSYDLKPRQVLSVNKGTCESAGPFLMIFADVFVAICCHDNMRPRSQSQRDFRAEEHVESRRGSNGLPCSARVVLSSDGYPGIHIPSHSQMERQGATKSFSTTKRVSSRKLGRYNMYLLSRLKLWFYD